MAHPTVDGELGELLVTLHFHGIERSLGLEARGFQRCPCDVPFRRRLRDAEDASLRTIDPMRCKQALAA